MTAKNTSISANRTTVHTVRGIKIYTNGTGVTMDWDYLKKGTNEIFLTSFGDGLWILIKIFF
uniref:Uncharacterized protein n=1 Tax=Anguilla anguilla TaxID=7936 RepID=A0A0E9X3U9_ANGAN